MTTSIVITTYNRNPQLFQTLASIRRQGFDGEVIVVDDGDSSHGYPSARFVCEAHGARHIPCRRSPSDQFRNPALPNNMGIRAAAGDVVILQNAECRHEDPRAIEKLTGLVTPTSAVFACVIAQQEDGSQGMLYCGPENPRPYFFCGAIYRKHLVDLRGFDEDYTGAGYDDDDLADRLGASGVQFVFSDVLVHHQWHAPAGVYADVDQMRELYQRKLAAMLRGELGIVRNVGRDWGGRP
jgi:glycosyltransferase involved in cell wall biosynthesis